MWRELLGLDKKPVGLVDILVPQRSFADVILPDETRQQLYEALTQIEKHRLIFSQWGLGERHSTGIGLVFNFAGPPGTGKTICAEAIAFTLGRKLMRIKYSELESLWVGETGKNIRAVFKEARTQEAVLFFDEADSVAARRFTNIQAGFERETNQNVNILLQEVEAHQGVVIFATNLASNFDPAFERRIRTHILFRIPGPVQRQAIWKVQIHPDKTPLAEDVDFRELAERFEVAGGDIRNAVLKAALMAAAEQGADDQKSIHQRHFIAAMEQVLRARGVMSQNSVDQVPDRFPWQDAADAAAARLQGLDDDLQACRLELGMLADEQGALRSDADSRLSALEGRLDEVGTSLRAATEQTETSAAELRGELEALRSEVAWAAENHTRALAESSGQQEKSLQALVERLSAQETRLGRATLIPLPPAVTGVLGLLILVVGALTGHFLWPR